MRLRLRAEAERELFWLRDDDGPELESLVAATRLGSLGSAVRRLSKWLRISGWDFEGFAAKRKPRPPGITGADSSTAGEGDLDLVGAFADRSLRPLAVELGPDPAFLGSIELTILIGVTVRAGAIKRT